MRIDLHNFFRYYDPKNPKHVAAVEQLEVDLISKCPELMDDTANWVRIYRTPVTPPTTGILNVPWFPQTDNYTQPDRTCNSSSCAMCLEYFKPGTLPGAKGDDAYLKKVIATGDTTDHSVQTKVLNSYGLSSEFRYNLGFADLDRELSNSRPVVIGILHRGSLSSPTGGHMLVVIGKKGNDYVVNDPYGSLNDGYTSAVANGKSAVYKRSDLQYRWLENNRDKTGWGRIFRP
jgi:predicted nucleic acid-binding Zn finger protein